MKKKLLIGLVAVSCFAIAGLTNLKTVIAEEAESPCKGLHCGLIQGKEVGDWTNPDTNEVACCYVRHDESGQKRSAPPPPPQ